MTTANRGPVKHRMLIRDSIQGITNPAIGRIAQTAGIKRVSGLVYEEFRGVMKTYMKELMQATLIFTEHDRRRTVKQADLDAALQVKGMYLGASVNPNTSKTFTTKKSRHRTTKNENNTDEDGNAKKPHRFKPGTVALQEIRYQQKHSDNFAIHKANFKRLVREIGQDCLDNIRYSHSFIELFQLVVEDHMVKLMQSANLCCIHAGRQTVMPSDIQLARRISAMSL